MNNIIQFIFKYMIPIALVKLILKRFPNLLIRDEVCGSVYHRLGDSKSGGADILIKQHTKL